MEYKCEKCYYFKEYFEDGIILIENECVKLELSCFETKKICKYFKPNISEYKKNKINEFKCKKCDKNNFKFKIIKDRLICKNCNNKIKKFIDESKIYSFLLFLNSLIDIYKEVDIYNLKKIEKINYKWIKVYK